MDEQQGHLRGRSRAIDLALVAMGEQGQAVKTALVAMGDQGQAMKTALVAMGEQGQAVKTALVEGHWWAAVKGGGAGMHTDLRRVL